MTDTRASSGVGQVLVKTNLDDIFPVTEGDRLRDQAAEAKRLRKAAKRAAIEARRDNNRV